MSLWCLIRGINRKWHARMSIASKDDGTRYMQKSSARPTSAGTDPGNDVEVAHGALIVSPGA